ncbi:MAG: cysteine-rich CWC family protein [Rhodocyclaceae bacterium]|nr:cysteine-rich CWC family protein [Rhodocyclaceae bacterium]
MESICAKCGATFSCGMVAGEAHCWCEDLPKLMPLDAEASACFCRPCLAREIAERNSPPHST